MLAQRVITALVLLAVIVPSIFLAAPWVWGLLSLIMLSVAGFEWGRLLGKPAGGRLMGALLAGLGVVFWFSIAPLSLLRVHRIGPGFAVGAMVLAACWVALYELRIESAAVLVSAMAIVWLADIGAYFAGRAFGRHKLAPRVSPGKTWEGVAGGMAAVLAVALAADTMGFGERLFSSHLAQHAGWPATLVLLVAIAALSVVGDLYESMLKRHAGMKDSGSILPGHGGILDRIDALIPTMPCCLLLLQLLR
jgi:phosphatidate cytidylyltransferase